MNAVAAVLAAATWAAPPEREPPSLSFCERRARETFAECEGLWFPEVMWFQDQGVSAFKLLGYRVDPTEMGIAAFWRTFPGWPPVDLDFEVRRARVQFLRGGRFIPESDRRCTAEKVFSAFIIPAIDDDGAMIDLVAWHPKTGRLASLERTTGWLAGGYLPVDAPLVVHPDPLSWLRAGRDGVVVVHEDIARPALLAQRTLQAADVAHGEALQAMLAKVRLPRIVVPVSSIERVAA